MLSILRVVILMLHFLDVRALLLPQNITSFQPANLTLPPALEASLSELRIATAQLPEHWDMMRIQYASDVRFATQILKRVLNEAFVQIIVGKHVYGDEGLLEGEFFVQSRGIIFKAGNHEHSPTETLTFGILEEAIGTLVWFTERRPYEMQALILEGLDGGGPPVGEILILKVDDTPSETETNNIQTS